MNILRNKKFLIVIFSILALAAGSALTFAMAEKDDGTWRYKMTVVVETPEGLKTGSAVRQMGSDYQVTFPAEASNYGEVSGEAVVVDLGERGVLFALITHNSDLEFYATFPVPWGGGGETPEGYEYYASLPVGTKAELGTDRYLRLVTFTDMDDPKSVTLVYDRETCARVKDTQEECKAYKDRIGTYTKANRFEELFGGGVRLKEIVLEITDEPVTWGEVDKYLTDSFWHNFGQWMKSMNIYERGKVTAFGKDYFKQGKSK